MSTEPAILPREVPVDADPIEAALHKLKGRLVRIAGGRGNRTQAEGVLKFVVTPDRRMHWGVEKDDCEYWFDAHEVVQIRHPRGPGEVACVYVRIQRRPRA